MWLHSSGTGAKSKSRTTSDLSEKPHILVYIFSIMVAELDVGIQDISLDISFATAFDGCYVLIGVSDL